MPTEQVSGLHIRRHDAFGPPARHGVDNAVQNLLPQIGHAYFIRIGKRQRHTQGNGVGVLAADAVLYSGVTARTRQNGQQ